MESVESLEGELNLNIPLPAPHIITSSSFSPPFFPQVSNPDAEEATENMPGKGEGTEDERKVVALQKEGNIAALSGDVIMDSVGSPEEEVKLNNPVPSDHIIPFSS